MRILTAAWMFVLATAVAAQEDRKHVVIVSIDGLRPEFYLDEAFEAPTLKEMARNGASARAVESVYPSVTYAAHASIVTGVRPGRHGIVSNTKFGETGGTSEWYWETKDLKARTIWQVARDAGRTVAITAWPSSVGADVNWLVPERWAVFKGETTANLLAKLSTKGLLAEMALANGVPKPDDIKKKDVMDGFIAGGAAYVLSNYKPGLLLLHLIQVDDAQHDFGRDAEEVKLAVKRTDANLERIRKAAEKGGILDRTVFVIVGDHGFEDVTESLAPNTLLAKAGLIELEDGKVKSWKALGHAHGGSMAVYAKDAEASRKAREVLESGAGTDGHKLFSIVDRKRLDELGYNPEASFALEAEPGFGFAGATSGELVGRKTGGQHGYLPTKPRLATGFVACGPGVRKVRIETMGVIDIAPTVAKLMGLEMKDVDGKALDILDLPSQENAEELYRKFEASCGGAGKCVSLKVKAEMTTTRKRPENDTLRGSFEGSFRRKGADKVSMQLSLKELIAEKFSMKSDGKQMSYAMDDQSALLPVNEELLRPLMRVLSETGLWVMTVAWPKEKSEEEVSPTGFKIAGRERVGDVEATILEYEATFTGAKIQIKMWLDAARGVPLKRVAVVDEQSSRTVVTETYSDWSTEEIPDKEFAVD